MHMLAFCHLFAVVYEQSVPGVDLRRLLYEDLLLVLKFHRPLVDFLLQLAVVHRGRCSSGGRGRPVKHVYSGTPAMKNSLEWTY